MIFFWALCWATWTSADCITTGTFIRWFGGVWVGVNPVHETNMPVDVVLRLTKGGAFVNRIESQTRWHFDMIVMTPKAAVIAASVLASTSGCVEGVSRAGVSVGILGADGGDLARIGDECDGELVELHCWICQWLP